MIKNIKYLINYKNLFRLFFVVIIFSFNCTSANAESKAVNIANIAGIALGRGTYCGFDTDELSDLAEKAIDSYSKNDSDDTDAIKQYMAASSESSQYGPESTGESCDHYKDSYNQIVKKLKNSYR